MTTGVGRILICECRNWLGRFAFCANNEYPALSTVIFVNAAGFPSISNALNRTPNRTRPMYAQFAVDKISALVSTRNSLRNRFKFLDRYKFIEFTGQCDSLWVEFSPLVSA